MKLSSQIKILVIGDSPIICQTIKRLLALDQRIGAVRTATNCLNARDKIVGFCPDVILLDLDMPNKDSINLLRSLSAEYPVPTLVMISQGTSDFQSAKQALDLGAIGLIEKPEKEIFIDQVSSTILTEIIAAYNNAKFINRTSRPVLNRLEDTSAKPFYKKKSPDSTNAKTKIIFIGASTGGTEALRIVFNDLPPKIPPICVVQHLGAKFSDAFARRLNEIYPFEVLEAKHGDLVLPDRVLIAPGGFHMEIEMSQRGQYYIRLNEGPKIWHQRPSVDILFHSAAKTIGKNAIGVIMTGMGQDGAEGLLAMKNAGARTIAQDQDSCIVYGMPKVAKERGAVDIVVPLAKIASVLQAYCSKVDA